ncbi:MAG: hypothetical protein JKX91_01395 [Rhizobiaceae bacterium]|nr:hypothetical protein [Rhizobiaceae bacterium]
MYEHDQQRELESSEANAKQSSQTELNEASSKADKLFDFENSQPENHLPQNGFHSGGSLGTLNWTPEALPIGQISLEETLEEELTSGVLENNSLSYIKTKANKLESAIREVNRECDNLIAVCDTDDEAPTVLPGDGMLLRSNGGSSNATSKRMLLMASAALFATCGVVYAYVAPQNPIKLAIHSKIAEFTNQPIVETEIKPSKNVYASLSGFTPSSSPLALQVEKTVKASSEPASPTVAAPTILANDLQKDTTTSSTPVLNLAELKTTDAPIVREVIPQTRQSRVPELQTSQANATDSVGLSELFGQKATSQKSQLVTVVLQDSNASNLSKQIQVPSPQLASAPKDPLRLQVSSSVEQPFKKRNKQAVERVVLQANARATLNNSQVKILVARLTKGDCLSSALHGIFGENKISPVFVRTLLTDMENRC